MEQYISVATLADRTQLSESFWRKAITRRLLPAFKVGAGRAIRVRLADAERFLDAGRRAARGER
jgi:excisionase family DNA binding protein